ncbi:MAG: DUF4386 domain-containing protein [Flavobacteriaceae bacterium]|nr:DUF4386 domain-containing protein [Flavobacteriaceae bacterium]
MLYKTRTSINSIKMQQSRISKQIYKARTIGILFLLAFLCYGVGRSLFESELFTQKHIGASLIIINSIMVLTIGNLLQKTIIKYNILTGNIYFFSRAIEAIALFSIVLNLIPQINISMDYGYFIAMLVLGIGSIPMCYIFHKYKLTPKWLALWGIIGYAVFAFGFLMELFGEKWSMYLLAPGGLWEITFAIWLILNRGKTNR